MFVSNLAPVLIVCSAAFVRGSENHLSAAEITQLLQCAMFAAGIGTCLQLYPVWKIGSRLPIVMGVSFTFLGSLLMICTNPELGYEGMVGSWYRQQRQQVQLLQCVPVRLDGISRWRNCRGLLPWMDSPVRFQDVLVACRLLLSVRISGLLR